MTELLYLDCDTLQEQALVLSCAPGQNGGYEVILDRTVFHPQGGGQPSDVGLMGTAKVLKVVHRDGAVVHCVDQTVALGPVGLRVDAPARWLHARLHSAGHLIGHAVAGLGLRATRAHHWPDDARVMVAHTSQGQPLSVEQLQPLVDDLIAQNLARVTWRVDVRYEVGFGELPPFPCGGTHVKFTGEIGRCMIHSISRSKEGQWIRYGLA